MKRGILVLLLALAAGLVAFCFMRSHTMTERHEVLMDSMPELAWLRKELKLTDEQFAKVSELHAAYRPKCEEMCQQISLAHEKLEEVARAAREMSPELQAALREHAETHARCQQAMLKHIYETAEVLDRGQASRYLEMTLPFALDSTASGSEPGNLHSR